MAEPAERCASCKFTLRRSDIKFGRPPLHSRHLTDRTASLSVDEIAKLRAELEIFDKRFPQSLLSVFITELPLGQSVTEYAFWLANRGRFSPIEVVGSDNFDLLLVVDPIAGAAAFTVGYGLEKYFTENALENVLTSARTAFREGDLGGGIRICIERTTQHMRDLSRELESDKISEKTSEEMAAVANN